MKNIVFYKILICFGLLWLTYGCEKADQTTSVNIASNGQLTSRDAGSCENCDVDDCCCGFELRHMDDPTTFRVCGFNNGTSTCNPTPPTGCNTINGGFVSQLLNDDDRKFAFCMLQGNCFQITNITFGSTGDIRISCDFDQVSPTFTNVTIPYLSTYTFCADGNCDVEQCNP